MAVADYGLAFKGHLPRLELLLAAVLQGPVNGQDQVVQGGPLEHVVPGPGLDGQAGPGQIGPPGDDYDLRGPGHFLEKRQHLKTVAVGHAHVQKNYIEVLFPGDLNSVVEGVGRVGPVALAAQFPVENVAEELVVVYDQNIRHGLKRCSGLLVAVRPECTGYFCWQ